MKLLANENVPAEAVTALRSHGNDVTWIHAEAPGSTDEQVILKAAEEGRFLLTFDKDFGELALRLGLRTLSGIILCRFPPHSAASVAEILVSTLATRSDWKGHFAVIEPGRVRMTPLAEMGR